MASNQQGLVNAWRDHRITIGSIKGPIQISGYRQQVSGINLRLGNHTIEHTPVCSLDRQHQLELGTHNITVEQQLSQQIGYGIPLQRLAIAKTVWRP